MARYATNNEQALQVVNTNGRLNSLLLQNQTATDVYVCDNLEQIMQTDLTSGNPQNGFIVGSNQTQIINFFVGKLYARSIVDSLLDVTQSEVLEDGWRRLLSGLLAKICGAFILFAMLGTLAGAQLTPKGRETTVNYTPPNAVLVPNKTPANNFVATTGLNTFILQTSPDNASQLYVTNETSNACTFTISAASASPVSISSFNNSPQSWQPVSTAVPGGTFAGSTSLAVPALGTATVLTNTILGSKIAYFIVGPGTCPNTTVDVSASFGAVFLVGNQVQGLLPNGSNGSGENPVTVSGIWAADGTLHAFGVCPNGLLGFACTNQTTAFGMAIGEAGIANTNQYAGHVLPQDGGPLAVADYANRPLPSGNSKALRRTDANNDTGAGQCNDNLQSSCSGLSIRDTGWVFNSGAMTINVGTPVSQGTWGNPANTGVITSCNFSLIVQTLSAGATLDVFIQDSPDFTNWNDRVHFQTTSAQNMYAITSATASKIPTATSNLALAANTIVDGVMAAAGQVTFTVTGPGGSNSQINFTSTCK